MTTFLFLLALCGAWPDSAVEESRLSAVRWKASSDTLRLAFHFEGGRPRRLRIAALQEPAGKPALRIEFEGVGGGKWRQKLPGWIHGITSVDSSAVEFRVDLRNPLAWRAVWKDDVLKLELAGSHRSSIWTDPRFLGLAGAAVATGATVVWLSAQEEPLPAPTPAPLTNPDDGIIPPPGFGFPR